MARSERPRLLVSTYGLAAVEFLILEGSPAVLEVFDVHGRRVWSREYDSPGPRRLEIGREGALNCGIFFVRLSQNGAQTTRKLVRLN